MMKGFDCCVSVVLVVIVILLVPEVMSTRHIGRPHSRHGGHGHAHSSSISSTEAKPKDGMNMAKWDFYKQKKPFKRNRHDTIQIAGSSLPDCSHACGSCSPCRLVMVSFVCASLAEAETCPMAYKCMCNNKSYPVP